MPDGVRRLAELGVDLPKERCAPFSGIRYVDGETIAEASFRGGEGLGIRRTVLHQALVEAAEARDVDLRWGVRCLDITDRGVTTDHGDFASRWVVGADGRNSMVRRLAGLDANVRQSPRIGIRRHYAREPWTDRVEVHWSDGCEAYVTPVARDLIGVAVLSVGGRVDFDASLDRFPTLARRLADAEPASRDLGAGPFGQRCTAAATDRIALVGDAAGSLDPISGEGLAIALHEAGAVVGAMTEGSLRQYRAGHRKIRRTPMMLTGLLTVMADHPAIRRRVTRALATSEILFERALAFGSRARPVRVTGRGGVLHMAWELARHGV
jgi:flavin-dependent dehydrogenase